MSFRWLWAQYSWKFFIISVPITWRGARLQEQAFHAEWVRSTVLDRDSNPVCKFCLQFSSELLYFSLLPKSSGHSVWNVICQ